MPRPKYSEEVILYVAKVAQEIATEFQSDLAIYGITPEWLEAFAGKIAAAEALPDEDMERVELRWLTQSKNEHLEACYWWGVRIRDRLEMRFGRDSEAFESFPAERFRQARKSERLMTRVMENLLQITERYRQELSGYGLTDAELEEGATLLEHLKAAEVTQEEGKVQKQAATQERYAVFQALYDDVNWIYKAGRRVFRGKPELAAYFRTPWPRYYSGTPDVAEDADQEALGPDPSTGEA